jgi:hypothetical protein
VKKVLVWSIQHTSTFFAIHAITSGFKEGEHVSRFGSLYQRHIDLGHERFFKHGQYDLSDWCPTDELGVSEEWFDKYILSLAKVKTAPPKEEDKHKVDWSKVKVFTSHDHHHKANTHLIKAIHSEKPGFSIVVPMRDPMLSLHSKIWREIEIHNNNAGSSSKQRLHRVSAWVTRYKELLRIPNKHRFILSVDNEQSKTINGRVKVIKKLHNFIGIPFNDRVKQFAEGWGIANSTQQLVKRKKKHDSNKWVNFKRQYIDGNINVIVNEMELEFDYLNKDEELKQLMKQFGYKELPWF